MSSDTIRKSNNMTRQIFSLTLLLFFGHSASDKPILLKVNFNGGHAGDMTNEENAMKQEGAKYAFILWQCGFNKANKYN